jgi:hypothetical protein
MRGGVSRQSLSDAVSPPGRNREVVGRRRRIEGSGVPICGTAAGGKLKHAPLEREPQRHIHLAVEGGAAAATSPYGPTSRNVTLLVVSLSRHRRLSLIILLQALTGFLFGQSDENATVFRGVRVEVIASPATSDGVMPSGPARLCIRNSSTCFVPPTHDPPFGFSPSASAVQLSPKRKALLFTADASAGGSGVLTVLAVLELRNGRWLNLLPDVTITNQGEFKLWQESSVSAEALFATVDAVLGEGESHFSPHRFSISAYAFNSSTGHYDLRDRFVTEKKYPSLDDIDKIDVLNHEKAEVIRRLQRQR